jgi:hypothetical protein
MAMRSCDIDGVFYIYGRKKALADFSQAFSHQKIPYHVLKYRPTKTLRYTNKIGMLEIID